MVSTENCPKQFAYHSPSYKFAYSPTTTFFLPQDVARLYKLNEVDVSVTLVESRKILGAFDTRLQSYAEKKITERKNFHLVKSTVTGNFCARKQLTS